MSDRTIGRLRIVDKKWYRIAGGALALCAALSLVIAGIVHADNIQDSTNGFSSTIGGTTAHVTQGSSLTVAYQDVANASPGTDPSGCDATTSSPVTVTVSVPGSGGVTADKSSIQFTACGTTHTQSVMFTGNTVGSYSITQSVTGGKPGSEFKNQADFTLEVDAPTPTCTNPADPTFSSTPATEDGVNGWFVTSPSVTASSTTAGATIHYSTDGTTFNTSAPAPLGDGSTTVYAYATSGTCQSNTVHQVYLVDTQAPDLAYTLTPSSPTGSNGWYNSSGSAPLVHFGTCDDPTPGSGLDPSTPCPSDYTFPEGTNQSGQQTVKDLAGHSTTAGPTGINVDLTAPTAPDANITPSAPAYTDGSGHNWYKDTVTIGYSGGTDATSGIDPNSYTPAQTFTTDNDNPHTYSGTVSDYAGNTSSSTTGTVYVDATAPSISYSGSCPTGVLKLHESDSATSIGWTASDGQSGLSTPSSGTLTLGTSTVGSHTATVPDAVDNVGHHTAGLSCSYTVTYNFSGFLQPINDTAHSVSDTLSVFKGGSTVPAKFQLTDANGVVVQEPNGDLPQWLTPQKGGPLSTSIDESSSTASVTSGNTYRWDSTSQQYIYNWSTKGLAAGYWYTIGVTLDDGQTYTVMVGLK